MKRIIVLTISLILSISLFSTAFADDDASVGDIPTDADSSASDIVEIKYPESALLSSVSDENVIEYDNMLREVAYQTALRSTGDYNYDAGDIYNLLWQTLVGNGSYYVKVYDNNTYNLYNSLITNGLISDILSSLQTIEGYNTYTDGVVQYTTASLLFTIASNINSNNQSISNGLFDYNQNPYLGLISTNLGTFETLFNSYATNSLNKLNTINSFASNISEFLELGIQPDVETIRNNTRVISNNSNTVVTNTNSIINSLSSSGAIASEIHNFNNSFNNISWTNVLVSMNIKDMNCIDIDIMSNNILPDEFILCYQMTFLDGIITYRYDVPIIPSYRNLMPDIQFGYISNRTFYPYDDVNYFVTVNSSRRYYSIYVSNLYNTSVGGYNVFIKLKFPNNSHVEYQRTLNPYVYYIESSNVDFYTINEYINMRNQNDIISTFKELYASDDLIQAKQEQQPFEDTVIDEFSGSGDASASIGDALAVGNISSTVKGAFTGQGGGTVSDALSVFDSSGTLYIWFSQANQNVINGVAPPYLRSAKGENEYTFIDDSLFNDIDYFADYKSNGGNYYD